MSIVGVIEHLSKTEMKFIGYGVFFETPVWPGHELYEDFSGMDVLLPMIRFSDGSSECIVNCVWDEISSINNSIEEHLAAKNIVYYPSTNRMTIPSI